MGLLAQAGTCSGIWLLTAVSRASSCEAGQPQGGTLERSELVGATSGPLDVWSRALWEEPGLEDGGGSPFLTWLPLPTSLGPCHLLPLWIWTRFFLRNRHHHLFSGTCVASSVPSALHILTHRRVLETVTSQGDLKIIYTVCEKVPAKC